MTNTIATSVSINFYNEDVRYKIDCYGLCCCKLPL